MTDYNMSILNCFLNVTVAVLLLIVGGAVNYFGAGVFFSIALFKTYLILQEKYAKVNTLFYIDTGLSFVLAVLLLIKLAG